MARSLFIMTTIYNWELTFAGDETSPATPRPGTIPRAHLSQMSLSVFRSSLAFLVRPFFSISSNADCADDKAILCICDPSHGQYCANKNPPLPQATGQSKVFLSQPRRFSKALRQAAPYPNRYNRGKTEYVHQRHNRH